MATDIQSVVWKFYNNAIARTTYADTPSAVYEYLGRLGFTKPGVTNRWKDAAASINYQYRGDIDMQNKVALGTISVAPINALFVNNEQGLWYDPSDFATMYQDSAGTTPVTGPGDPVGLILDKRLWRGQTREQAAIRQVTADFNSGVDSFAGGASGSVAAVSGELQLTTGAANSYGYRDIATTAGKWYRAKAKLRVVSGSGGVLFRAATTGFANFVSHGSAIVGAAPAIDVSVIYYATTSTSRFYIQQNGSGGNSVFALDDFALDEIPGNHASQGTSAARPVLARVPFGGRRNLLIRTEDYSTGWTLTNASGSAARNGNVLTFGANALDRFVQSNVTLAAAQHTGSIVLSGTGAVRLYMIGGDGTAGTPTYVTLTATPTRYSITRTPAGSGASGGIGIYNNAGASPSTVTIDQAQLETGAAFTAYQKVTSTHDVTEAGKADCWHLSFDGSDDFLVTGSVDFSAGDKLAVFLGAYKASDAANGAIVELSSSPGTSPGRFSIRGPDANAAASYGTFLIGATQSTFYSHTTYTAPITNVLSAMLDIAGANREQNIAARINAVLNTSGGGGGDSGLGGGNFDNQPIYIGRRGGSTLPFNGKLFGLVIRAGIPTAAQIVAAESYMAGKAGITL